MLPASLLPLTRVLVPTDLSPRAEAAVDFATRLAAADGAEVVLLHVFAFPYDWYHWPTEALTGLRKHVEQEAEARVADLARRKATPAVRVRPRLAVHADVPSAILTAAETEGAGLVVMGTHGWTGERPTLGSVTAQVVRAARCPVLAVPHESARPEEQPLGRVVVPVDFSDGSAEALRLGHALAVGRGVPLVAFHVVGEDVLAAESWGDEPAEAADAPLIAQYEHALRRFTEDALGAAPDARLTVAAGLAAGILDVADRDDLLVLAPRHGGALTESVLAHAPCPALVLPDATAFQATLPAATLPAAAPPAAVPPAAVPPRAATPPRGRTEAPALAL